MQRYLFVVLATLLAAAQASAVAPPVRGSELMGGWSVIVWDQNGVWMSAGDHGIGELYRSIVVEFTRNRVSLRIKDKPWFWKSAYKTNHAQNPKEIDVRVINWDSDGKGELTDVVFRGIYSLQGNRLTICIDRRTKDSRRPDHFAVAPKRNHLILQLERQKK
jgi:uncharacterized protein (TIGR03067 family)